MSTWQVRPAFIVALLMPAPMYGKQIINISSANANGVVLELAAGQYTVGVAGIARGGTYDAWNPWNGAVAGCNRYGRHCSQGYTGNFAISIGGAAKYFYSLTNYYSTPAGALKVFRSGNIVWSMGKDGSNVVVRPISFVLTSATTVTFSIVDSYYPDNIGGVSLVLRGPLAQK